MTKPTKPQGIRAMLGDRKTQLAVAALAILAIFYLRSRSSSSSATVTNPNAIDPATGQTYAAEALAAQGGATIGGSSPTSDQVTTPDGTSVSAALEGLASGLTSLQTTLANEAAQIQSQGEAGAQLTQAVAQLTTLAAAGPAVAPPTTNVVYNAPINNDYAGGDTVYQAPVTVIAPAASTSKPASSPPKATTPPKPPTISTKDAVSANHPGTHT